MDPKKTPKQFNWDKDRRLTSEVLNSRSIRSVTTGQVITLQKRVGELEPLTS